MGSGPPKCKTCGKAEWRHRCVGSTTTKARSPSRPKSAPKSSSGSVPPAGHHGSPSKPIAVTSAAGGTSGISEKRKTYLKLKARERRKRERAAADKLGITVAEYRFRRGKGEFK